MEPGMWCFYTNMIIFQEQELLLSNHLWKQDSKAPLYLQSLLLLLFCHNTLNDFELSIRSLNVNVKFVHTRKKYVALWEFRASTQNTFQVNVIVSLIYFFLMD